MKTQVRFRSSHFPPYPEEEEQINPGVWGRRLAEHLARTLAEKGIPTGTPFAEDWGWMLPIHLADAPLALCCGHQDGDDDEFLCFTEPSQPVVRKLFRKVDLTAPMTRLLHALAEILESDPQFHAVIWETPGEKAA